LSSVHHLRSPGKGGSGSHVRSSGVENAEGTNKLAKKKGGKRER